MVVGKRGGPVVGKCNGGKGGGCRGLGAEVGKRDRVTNLLAGFFFIACGVLEGACGGPPTLYTVTYGRAPSRRDGPNTCVL